MYLLKFLQWQSFEESLESRTKDKGSVLVVPAMASNHQGAFDLVAPHMAHVSSCCQQSCPGYHSHSWMVPLAQNFLCSFKELMGKGISGFICLSLVVDLFVTHGLMMANLLPLQDLFLEWFSCSFFLCRSKYPQSGGIPKCLFSTSWHGPTRKTILPLSARTCSPGQVFPE